MRVLFILIVLASCSDIFKKYYSDYNELFNSGDLKKGWIPDFIPVSAYDIYEKHNLDTNEIWLNFRFKKKDFNNIVDQMQQTDSIAQSKIKTIINKNFQINESDLLYYKYSKGEFVAINNVTFVCYYCRINILR